MCPASGPALVTAASRYGPAFPCASEAAVPDGQFSGVRGQAFFAVRNDCRVKCRQQTWMLPGVEFGGPHRAVWPNGRCGFFFATTK